MTTDAFSDGQQLDQASGLRQLLRFPQRSTCTPGEAHDLRIVLINETPATIAGARWSLHLARTLADHDQPAWLVDLEPSVSRLAHVVAEQSAARDLISLWTDLATKPLADFGSDAPDDRVFKVAATSAAPSLEQLPRMYEQLIRKLRSAAHKPRWLVLLAAESRLPLERACWQAAHDVILLTDPSTFSMRLAQESVASRLSSRDPQQRTWSITKRRSRWLERQWLRRLLMQLIPLRRSIADKSEEEAVAWPAEIGRWSGHWSGLWSEHFQHRQERRLQRSAERFARSLVSDLQATESGEDTLAMNNFEGTRKNIQLPASLGPMIRLSDKFRA